MPDAAASAAAEQQPPKPSAEAASLEQLSISGDEAAAAFGSPVDVDASALLPGKQVHGKLLLHTSAVTVMSLQIVDATLGGLRTRALHVRRALSDSRAPPQFTCCQSGSPSSALLY